MTEDKGIFEGGEKKKEIFEKATAGGGMQQQTHVCVHRNAPTHIAHMYIYVHIYTHMHKYVCTYR